MRICPQCRFETDDAMCPNDGYRTVVLRDVAPDSEDPMVGRIFEGRYQVLDILGRGGFGAVYRASQLGIGRDVAIKVLAAEVDQELPEIARFQQEARALAALDHPNIIKIYDFGQAEDGGLYLVMEYLRGKPLNQHLAQHGRLPPREVVEIALQIADALGEAHAKGIVHRDLKPHNLFLAESGRRTTVKVLDFGIARVLESSGQAAAVLTRTGAFIGSPPYMSPEQSSGRPVTTQSDLYSLGCVLHELLLGRLVFDHTSATAFAVAHCMDTVAPPHIDGVPLHGPLVDLVMALLEKDPQARPNDIEAVSDLLMEMRAAPLDASSMTLAEGGRGRESVTVAQPVRVGGIITGHINGANAPLTKPRKSTVWVWAVAATALLGVALALAFIVGTKAEAEPRIATPQQEPAPTREALVATPEPTPTQPAPTTPEPAGPEHARPEPGAAPTPTPTTTPVATPVVPHAVQVASTPEGAEVWRDDALLGTTPVTVQWDRASAPPTIELKAPRHRSVKLVLTPEDAATGKREVTLQRLRPTTTSPAGTPEVVGPSW